MKIKNHEIESFGKFLYNLKLRGKASRMRTRMINLLDSHLIKFNEERLQIIHESAQKNEDGTIKYEENTNNILLKPEKLEEINNELSLLLNEELIIEENETHKDMILCVADIILNCDEEMSDQQAFQYDKWCCMFEEAISNYSSS